MQHNKNAVTPRPLQMLIHPSISKSAPFVQIGIWVSIAKEPFMESEKSKPDYKTMTISLQFNEDPIWFGQVVTKKYWFL